MAPPPPAETVPPPPAYYATPTPGAGYGPQPPMMAGGGAGATTTSLRDLADQPRVVLCKHCGHTGPTNLDFVAGFRSQLRIFSSSSFRPPPPPPPLRRLPLRPPLSPFVGCKEADIKYPAVASLPSSSVSFAAHLSSSRTSGWTGQRTSSTGAAAAGRSSPSGREEGVSGRTKKSFEERGAR